MTEETEKPTPRAGAEPQPAGPASPADEVGSPEQIEELLDQALADSFPASDPVSIATSQREEAWEKGRDKARPDRTDRTDSAEGTDR